MGYFRLCTGQGLPTGGDDEPSARSWPLSIPVQDGIATITRSFYLTYVGTESHRELNPAAALKATGLPAYADHLAGDTKSRYRYLGNGTLEHLAADSKYWVYHAEYTYVRTRSSSSRDKDPWDRPPSNVSISFPETVVPFRAAYNSNNNKYSTSNEVLVPVCNSAGDLLLAETHSYAVQLSFSYFVKSDNFSLENTFAYNHSVNKDLIKVCGLTFAAESALITSIAPQYHEESVDSSDKKTHKYWEIAVTIQADTEGSKFRRVLLDIGNRARWPSLTVGADGSVTAGTQSTSSAGTQSTSSDMASQIYRWRTFDSKKGQMNVNGHFAYGHKYALAEAQEKYQALGSELPEFQFEKLENMPLRDGYLYLDPVQRGAKFGMYNTRRFREFPVKAWSGLNMPEKGVDW